MGSFSKSRKQQVTGLMDYYSLRVVPIWNGLRQESWAFWFLCIYIFFEYVRPDLIYPSISVLPWTQIAIIFTFLAVHYDRSVGWVKSSTNTYVILFSLIVILSSIFAFKPFVAWSSIHIILIFIVIHFFIITIVNTEKRFLIVILLFLLANFKMSLFAARTFAARGFTFDSWGIYGVPGWFENANDLGLQMNIFFPMAIVFIYALKDNWGLLKKIFMYMMPVTAMLTIVASSSRGAQLGLVSIAVWYALKSRLGLRALIGVIVFGVALYQVAPPEMLEKIRTSGSDSTSVSRLALWEYGVGAALKNPLLGVGYENWMESCTFDNPRGLRENNSCLDPHNTYVEAAAEIGIIGLVIYLILCIKIFIINAQTRTHARTMNNRFIFYMSHGLDAGMIGYLVSSVFLSVLFYPVIWVHLAMVVALHEIAKKQSKVKAAQDLE